jgi:MFS family permease
LLLQHGYTLQAVIVYFIIFFGVDVPLNWVADRLIRRFGAVEVTIAGIGSYIAFLLAFSLMPPSGWGTLLVMALFLAIYDTFFWVGHMYIFAVSEDTKADSSTDAGIMQIVRKLGSMAGPMVGGVLLILGTEYVLIAGSIALLGMSMVPLLFMRRLVDKPRTSPRPLLEFLKHPRDRFNLSTMLLYAFHGTAEDDLWPIFIFLTFGTIGSVALLASIAAAASLIFSYIAGRISKYHAVGLIAIGSFAIMLIWLGRISLSTPVFEGASFVSSFYYVSLVLVGFFALFISIPLEGGILARGKETEPLSAMTYRNAASMFTPFLLYLVLFVLLEVFKISFAIAAVSMLMLVLLASLFARMVPRPQERSL